MECVFWKYSILNVDWGSCLMKKRAIVVMVCAIGFVASFVIIGYFGLTSIGIMDRMYTSQSKQLVIGTNENLSPLILWNETEKYT